MTIKQWKDFLKQEAKQEYFINIKQFITEEAKTNIIYPKREDLFSVYKSCELDKIKVVIIGQDPYHGPNQAHGLAFSVKEGNPVPPSLRNIFKEIITDIGSDITFANGCLTKWAEQGVFLLNSILTVRQGQAGSHKNCGWQTFTDKTIQLINEQEQPIAFMLWGNFAKSKSILLNNSSHSVLSSSHPSPLGAHNGFIGCKHFSKANEFLIKNNIQPIDWSI